MKSGAVHSIRALDNTVPHRATSGVRTLCMTVLTGLLLSTYLVTPASADCPAAPLASADDLVVSFVSTQGGTQVAPSTLFASTVKEGMLVYDDTNNALKLCDGTNWVSFVAQGGAGATQWLDGTGGAIYYNGGNVGIGTASPGAKLHVAGGVKIGDDTGTCPGSGNVKLGTLRFNSGNFEVCQSGGWAAAAGGASGVGGAGYVQISDGSGGLTTSGNTAGQEFFWDNTDKRLGIGTATPDTSAALDVTSTTKGFLPPRMTTAQRDTIASPAMGLMIFNTSLKRPQFFTGTIWVSMGIVPDGTSDFAAAASCNAILANGYSTGDGTYWIRPGSTAIQVYCDMTTDGGGYTYYPVTGGIQTYRSTDNNTCKTLGMDIAVPRTQAHLGAMISRYGSGYFAVVPGISKSAGGGNYTGCIMRDPSAYGSGCSDWVAVDGGAWWLRNSTYSEPNGDYTANCWLNMTNHGNINDIRFNDLNCNYSTTQYVCSTNDK